MSAGVPQGGGGPCRVKAVIERGGRYLLAQHHTRRPANTGKWTFLGGRIDPTDASPAAALVRELREELGVRGRVRAYVGDFPYRDDPGPCAVLLADFVGAPRPNEEIVALRWYSRDELGSLARGNLLRLGFECEAVDRAVALVTRGQRPADAPG